ncbi:hypothetical protein FA13DRAFT_1794836 [Coprinellus micaceus]|uniref:S-adenosyl-L-methionine dependent methyltransferase n=1 Tax=Coprinellus micaceus TaxID=71717 RepID=A0A4Y7T0E4_COPMI|nr:hypothetical protein FA13DRAFT_1794836 [Coprinellus micaceus]
MHPRNPYNEALDFKLLASKYPPLQAHVNQNGGIDFLDPAAQRALTKAILKTDFDLDVELPDDRLCPPVPNRLNYVLWVEGIVEATSKFTNPSRGVSGLDVGTGASAIYPLLCCRQNPIWEMFATEIDPTSLSCAQRNVSTNALDGRIHLSRATANDSDSSSPSSHTFGPLFADPNLEIGFTMCNPPFYSSAAEIHTSKTEKEDEAFSVCTGSANEMIYSSPSSSSSAAASSSPSPSPYAECEREGGEVGFVARMVRESLVIRERCRWYTSMLGKMSSVPKIVGLLKVVGITNYIVTQFIQGQTRRWALGWSVGGWWRLPDTISRLSHLPSSHSLATIQPARTTLEYSLDKDPTVVLHDTLEGMKHGGILEVEKVTSPTGVVVEFLVKARENIWSRAARRKMKQKAMQAHPATPADKTGDPSDGTRKRKRDVDEGQGGSNTARKKGRVDSNHPKAPEQDEYKMICTVSLSALTGELGEAASKRWTLRMQWVYGKDEDREMFEGFASHIERKVSQGA